MVMLEQGGGVAFDMKAGGPLELALVPKDGDPETVALRGKDVAVLLAVPHLGDRRAGPLHVKSTRDNGKIVWELSTALDGRDGTTVHLTSQEMSMLRRAVESRLWRMYQ